MAATRHRIMAPDLQIDLAQATDAPVFRWLVACLLSGTRISQDMAARACPELGTLTPRGLAGAGWPGLVGALGRDGYRRFHESAARELICLGRCVPEDHDGHAARLRDGVDSKGGVAGRVQELTGIGPVAAGIFVREITPAWGS